MSPLRSFASTFPRLLLSLSRYSCLLLHALSYHRVRIQHKERANRSTSDRTCPQSSASHRSSRSPRQTAQQIRTCLSVRLQSPTVPPRSAHRQLVARPHRVTVAPHLIARPSSAAAKAGVAMLKEGNIGEKPRSSISDLIDILCLDRYDEDSYEGLAELVESINLQPHTGCAATSPAAAVGLPDRGERRLRVWFAFADLDTLPL